MDEIVFRVGEELVRESVRIRRRIRGLETDLVDDLVPFLAANSYFDRLVHKPGRDDNAMEFVGDAPGGFGDW